MSTTPLISVAMSTFNPEEEELKQAVESIIAQSFDSWELLIYDDGSEQEKADLIKRIADLDPRIRCLRGERNQGIAAGLNECIKFSRGTYIARMDDDDRCLPERFEKQVDFLNLHQEYQWVGVLAGLFDDSGVWGRADRPEYPVPEDFFHSSPFIHPGVMFRKSMLTMAGGYRVHKTTQRCEDYELFMRLYASGFRGCNLQEVLLLYREESGRLKRSWKFCYYESLVRFRGFRQLNLLSLKAVPYVFKPLAVRMIAVFPKTAQRIRTRRNKGDHIVSK